MNILKAIGELVKLMCQNLTTYFQKVLLFSSMINKSSQKKIKVILLPKIKVLVCNYVNVNKFFFSLKTISFLKKFKSFQESFKQQKHLELHCSKSFLGYFFHSLDRFQIYSQAFQIYYEFFNINKSNNFNINFIFCVKILETFQ